MNQINPLTSRSMLNQIIVCLILLSKAKKKHFEKKLSESYQNIKIKKFKYIKKLRPFNFILININ
jgi:hypothetical protein